MCIGSVPLVEGNLIQYGSFANNRISTIYLKYNLYKKMLKSNGLFLTLWALRRSIAASWQCQGWGGPQFKSHSFQKFKWGSRSLLCGRPCLFLVWWAPVNMFMFWICPINVLREECLQYTFILVPPGRNYIWLRNSSTKVAWAVKAMGVPIYIQVKYMLSLHLHRYWKWY